MNYWHMQLHPTGEKFQNEHLRRILIEKNVIGLGEWDDGESQIYDFKERIKIGDVVAVKNGACPVALVQVTSESWEEVQPDLALDWFPYRRNIKILDLYRETDQFQIPQPRGTLNICNNLAVDTSQVILNWHQRYLSEQQNPMKNTISLLRHKKQIILQGPPGTGKTRLAKQIAQSMTQEQKIASPETVFDQLLEKFNPDDVNIQKTRNEHLQLRAEFNSQFPKENLKDLTLDTYCIGKGDKENFCWWIERGLKTLGSYSPGSARAYLIFWKKDVEAYSKHQFVTDMDDQAATKAVAEVLHDCVNHRNPEQAAQYFGNGVLLKILNSYYPDEYFPINSENMMNHALAIFKIDLKGLSAFQKNQKLMQIYHAKKAASLKDISVLEFAQILWQNFNLKEGEKSDGHDGWVTRGDSQLIQFHPAYAYEDFVRGIVADTTDGGLVTYQVQNKVLAQFAQTALDDPNGNYVLIIDEINRANLSSVLGELIYALEYRGEAVASMYEFEGQKEIVLPSNLYIIGTMNTADRSIGHIDYAIRRRFAFVDVLPDEQTISNPQGKKLFQQVSQLFAEEYLSVEFKPNDVMLGHSYFLSEDTQVLAQKLEYEIKPILREYLKDGVLLESVAEKIESLYVQAVI